MSIFARQADRRRRGVASVLDDALNGKNLPPGGLRLTISVRGH
jgi:hypothetical protein